MYNMSMKQKISRSTPFWTSSWTNSKGKRAEKKSQLYFSDFFLDFSLFGPWTDLSIWNCISYFSAST